MARALLAEGFEAIPEPFLSHRLADVDDRCADDPSTVEVFERVLAKARTSDRVLLEERVGELVVLTQHDVDPVPLRHATRVQSDKRCEAGEPEGR
ncbi:MAG: hypothetical protein CMH82_14880 [Nocardioides sp.]|nr:hypothetical protein [Nocardioides sp.]